MKMQDIPTKVSDNVEFIGQLQAKARTVLDPLIPVGANVVLIDYPNTTNVGDSLIWLGEWAYLKSRQVNIQYVCDIHHYSAKQLRKVITDDTIILLHGGGNFGTVWPELQLFRIQVLKDFADVKTIQFPQSIFFDEPSMLVKETATAIESHSDFTLLTRGNPSFIFAKEMFACTTFLCPDMAFFIGALSVPTTPSHEVFALSRTDHEKSAGRLDQVIKLLSPQSLLSDDWLNPDIHEKVLYKIEYYTRQLRRVVDPNNRLMARIWTFLSHCRLKRGVRLLSQGEFVLTDRLHVHILATLMNKPHILVDNSYGKLGRFYHTWCHDNPVSFFIHDVSSLSTDRYFLQSWLATFREQD